MSLTIRIFVLLLALHVCKGAKNNDIEWWENGHFYHIYVRSFQDSNGDGIGDLNGIIQRLTHLKYIGVEGILLSPINPSPLKDHGYDVSDYREIDPNYGKMEDFDRLLAECDKINIKIILDFVPNHTSNQHQWFKISSDPTHADYKKYKDYYIWNKGKMLPNGTRVEPSNWLSVFGGSAWEWMESRKEYYLHQFYSEQPDLNFRNSAVKKEMDETMRFWLRKGVAGFRLDAVGYLMESKVNKQGYYDDEPVFVHSEPQKHAHLKHIHTKNLEETYDLVYQFHDVVKEKKFSNFPRILFTEDYSVMWKTLKYFGKVKNGKIIKSGVEVPFMLDAIEKVGDSESAYFYKKCIVYNYFYQLNDYVKEKYQRKFKIHPNWVLGNHDRHRISYLGENRIDLLNILMKTLPGIAITYYGEEIGMTDVEMPKKDGDNSNEFNRDKCRTPMQWDNTKNAGFSTCQPDKTWLPIASNYREVNVELQKKSNHSHLYIFHKLGELRKTPIMKYGTYELYDGDDKNILAFKRYIDGKPDVIAVFLNFASYVLKVNGSEFLKGLPDRMEIYISANNLKGMVGTNELLIPASSGLVLVGKSSGK